MSITDQETEFVLNLQKALLNVVKEYTSISKDLFKSQKDLHAAVGTALTMFCTDLDKELDPRFTYGLLVSLMYILQ